MPTVDLGIYGTQALSSADKMFSWRIPLHRY